jgi:Flp pilus assembly protein TadG
MLRLPSSELPIRGASFYRSRGQRGASLVEYAFVVFIFLTLIFGIGGFGHALFVYHHLNNAAKEATRYAAVRGFNCALTPVGQPSCTALNSATGIAGPTTKADVQAYVQSITPQSIDSTKLIIVVCGVSDSTAACPASVASGPVACALTFNYPGCTAQVQVAYPYNFIFPLLPTFTTATAPCTSPGLCMSSTSDMIIVH